jgi:hypothetical protein
MKSISTARVNHILSLLDSDKDGYAAARSAGVSSSTVSRIHKKDHPSLQKSLRGCLAKLSPTNIHHAQHLIYSGKVKNAGQLTKPLVNIINPPLSTQTVCCTLNKAGMVAVKKWKRPFLNIYKEGENVDGNWVIEGNCLTAKKSCVETKI